MAFSPASFRRRRILIDGRELALKARAARAQDLRDLRLLATDLGATTADEVFHVVDRFFPDDPMGAKAKAVIEDLFG